MGLGGRYDSISGALRAAGGIGGGLNGGGGASNAARQALGARIRAGNGTLTGNQRQAYAAALAEGLSGYGGRGRLWPI